MNICFDLICDEALLLSAVAKRLEREENIKVSGFSMGRRWAEGWDKNISIYPFKLYDYNTCRAETNRIAREYADINPAAFLIADRFLGKQYSQSTQISFLVSFFLHFETLIEIEQPDVLVTTGVAYAYNLVALTICKKKGIPHLSLYSTRQNEAKFTFSTDYGGYFDNFDLEFTKAFNEISVSGENAFAEEIDKLHEFQFDTVKPSYMRFARQKGGIRFVLINEFLRRCKYWYKDKWRGHPEDYITKAPAWYARRDLARVARRLLLNTISPFQTPSADDRYYLFPLHLQPEASTLVLAPEHVDQIEAVRNIARQIPFGKTLYVKEHPASYGYRPRKFYRKLKQLHNVKLMSPDHDAKKLAKNAEGVIVLSGTTGWEALLLGTPVFVLGDVFYARVDGINKVSGYVELGHVLRNPNKVDRHSMLAALRAIDRCGAPGIFDVTKMDSKSKVLDADNILKITKGIKSFAMSQRN